MGLTTIKKVELDTYQLKGVVQTSYFHWRDNRSLRGGLVALEVFKKAFLINSFLGRIGNLKWWSSSTFIKEV